MAAEADERSPLLGHADRNTEAEASQDETPLPEEPSVAKLALVMGSTWVGVFLAALDSTIVATLSARIATSFNSLPLLSWLATAYLVANAGVQPISGKLTDIFSRRTGLILSNIFFGTGTLICGLAQNETTIIAGRVIAGIGGGCLNTISTFVASDLVPLRQRAMWQGFGNVFYGLGAGLGGVYGGWINDTIGWRWAFLIQLPVIVISGIVAIFAVNIPVKETDTSKIKRVDFLGAFTLVVSMVLLLIGLNSGGNVVPWNHPLVYVSLPLAGLCFLLFIYVEDRVAAEPIIPVRFLLRRTVASACLVNWFMSMSFYSILYYAPLFFQINGLSPTAAGARIMPGSAGASLGSLIAGIIMRATGGYFYLNIVVESFVVVGTGLLVAFLNYSTPLWLPLLSFLLIGTGQGGMLTVTLLALISAVDHEFQAVITSASYAFRSTGSTIGITISSAIYQNVLKVKLWEYLGDRDGASDIIDKVRGSVDEIKNLSPEWKNGVLHAYLDAIQSVWWTAFAMACLAAAISLLMRENVLHTNLARR